MTKCPRCDGEVMAQDVYLEVARMLDPPAQVGKYLHVVVWQCMRNGWHRGQRRIGGVDILPEGMN